MYRVEHVVVAPANHAYARIVFDKEQCTARGCGSEPRLDVSR